MKLTLAEGISCEVRHKTYLELIKPHPVNVYFNNMIVLLG